MSLREFIADKASAYIAVAITTGAATLPKLTQHDWTVLFRDGKAILVVLAIAALAIHIWKSLRGE